MKISEMYGGKHIATIALLSQSVGITVSEQKAQRIKKLVECNARFFVFIDRNGIDLYEVGEYCELFGKIVSGRVRRSKVLFFHDGSMREVTAKNLNDTLRMIMPKRKIELDDRRPVPKRVVTSFDIMQTERPAKKLQKRGFRATEIAYTSMYRFTNIPTYKPENTATY